jgi:large subunit ribosomal protein L30
MAKKKVEEVIVKKLRITLIRSGIGYSVKHKATIRALGLHRMNQTVEQVDGPVLQGMLRKVEHLVKVEVQETK